jgi:hypothetical protein
MPGYALVSKEDSMKTVSLLLVTLLVYNPVVLVAQAAPVSGTTQVQTRETLESAKIKAEVQKRGIGEKSRVRVELMNGVEEKAYISKIEESSFTVTDNKTGQTTTISYADVQKIRGPGLSKGAKIAIGVGVGVAVVAAVLGAIFAAALKD